MKAKTICPNCKEEVVEECRGCIFGGTLLHACSPTDPFDVEYELVELSEKEHKKHATDLNKPFITIPEGLPK